MASVELLVVLPSQPQSFPVNMLFTVPAAYTPDSESRYRSPASSYIYLIPAHTDINKCMPPSQGTVPCNSSQLH